MSVHRPFWTSVCLATFCAVLSGVPIVVNVSSGRIPISPYIYGANQPFPTVAHPAKRLGGNRMTGYNWENNASNAGSDWNHTSDNFVPWNMGIPDAQANIPGIALTWFHDRLPPATTTLSLITLQMAGYAARDKNGSVSVGETAPSSRWVEVRPRKGAAFSTAPSTADGYVYMDEMVNLLVQRYGPASSPTGVKAYALDNEPDLWSHTHPRIHPNPVGCVELIARSTPLAHAVKDVDPDALMFGPVSYGFNGYLSLQDAPDWNAVRGSHSWFLDYYLERMRIASQAAGRRLLDVLTIHWYPEARGGGSRITFDPFDPNNIECNKARMQAPRTLWDPTYIEDSWIGQWGQAFLPLIPRVLSGIATHYPGTKLAITEYNYGGERHISGGIAQADVLGIFGRYGVFAAFYWQMESPRDYVRAAFDLYLNYDGAGSGFGTISVGAMSGNVSSMTAHAAVRDATDNQLHLIVINKHYDNPLSADITIAGTARQYRSARVWMIDATTSTITERTPVPTITSNTFSYVLPRLSVAHFVVVASTAGSSNQPPVVNLTAPSDGGVYSAPANIPIAATATDPDGGISRVEFWRGGTLLNADTASPYQYTWMNVGVGTYTIHAVAYDQLSATGTSGIVTVYVASRPSVNQPPMVGLVSPLHQSSYAAPADIVCIATATDVDGTVIAVEFFNGTTSLAVDSASPWVYTWSGVGAGMYQLTARATDNGGATNNSAAVNVTVYPPNQPPVVSLTSPVNNSTYTAPATIQLTATATDPDGSIANVRFYRGSTLLNTDSASPYEYTWINVSSGTHQLRAVAQDNQGATSTSTIITVTVLSSSTPAVWYTLTATANPANGGTVTPASGTYLAGSQIQVTATPNANYTFATWSGDASGTNPTVTLTMDSDKSITANFTYVPPANSSPTVSITSPQDGATFAAPASITITATATDSDGSIAAVRFYAGTTLLATDSTSPYEYTWTGVPAGSYLLTVQAQDNQGAVGTSTAIGITVSAQAVYYTLTVNANPATGGTVVLNPPPAGSGYLVGTTVTVTATPNAGYEFAVWSGAVTSSAASITVTMDGNKTLTANFRAVESPQPQQPVLKPGEVRVVGGQDGYINATTNPNVVIRFRRRSAGVVTVRIYDLRGRLVMEKSKDGQAGIDDDIVWNAGDMPAGVYIVRVKGDGVETSRRVGISR